MGVTPSGQNGSRVTVFGEGGNSESLGVYVLKDSNVF
jgi:hypothetical protein